MVRFERVLIICGVAALLSACASGVDRKASKVDWNKGSVVVMSMAMTNKISPSYGPSKLGVAIEDSVGSVVFADESVSEGSNEVLLVKHLPPGSYTITSLRGSTSKFPVLVRFSFRVEAPIDVPANSVVYLGHIELTNKEMTSRDDQETAGSQPGDPNTAGFGHATLHVALNDRSERDMASLKQQYPALGDAQIVRTPLKQMALHRRMGTPAPKLLVRASGSEFGVRENSETPRQK